MKNASISHVGLNIPTDGILHTQASAETLFFSLGNISQLTDYPEEHWIFSAASRCHGCAWNKRDKK